MPTARRRAKVIVPDKSYSLRTIFGTVLLMKNSGIVSRASRMCPDAQNPGIFDAGGLIRGQEAN